MPRENQAMRQNKEKARLREIEAKRKSEEQKNNPVDINSLTNSKNKEQELQKTTKKEFAEPPSFDELMEQAGQVLLNKETMMMLFNWNYIQINFYQNLLDSQNKPDFRIIKSYSAILEDAIKIAEGNIIMSINSIDLVLSSTESNVNNKLKIASVLSNGLEAMTFETNNFISTLAKQLRDINQLKNFKLASNFTYKFNNNKILSDKREKFAQGFISVLSLTDILIKYGKNNSNLYPGDNDGEKYIENELKVIVSENLRDSNNIKMTGGIFLKDLRYDDQSVTQIQEKVSKNPISHIAELIEMLNPLFEGIKLTEFETEIDLLLEKFRIDNEAQSVNETLGDKNTSSKINAETEQKNEENLAISRKNELGQKQLQMYQRRLELLGTEDGKSQIRGVIKLGVNKLADAMSKDEIDQLIAEFESKELSDLGTSFLDILDTETGFYLVSRYYNENEELFSQKHKIPQIVRTQILECLRPITSPEYTTETYIDRWQTINVDLDRQDMLLALPKGIKSKAVEILTRIEEAGGVGLYRLKIQKSKSSTNVDGVLDYGIKEVSGDLPRMGVKKDDIEFDIGDAERMFLRGNNGHSELIWAGEPHKYY